MAWYLELRVVWMLLMGRIWEYEYHLAKKVIVSTMYVSLGRAMLLEVSLYFVARGLTGVALSLLSTAFPVPLPFSSVFRPDLDSHDSPCVLAPIQSNTSTSTPTILSTVISTVFQVLAIQPERKLPHSVRAAHACNAHLPHREAVFIKLLLLTTMTGLVSLFRLFIASQT
jgi:hypothetical protein